MTALTLEGAWLALAWALEACLLARISAWPDEELAAGAALCFIAGPAVYGVASVVTPDSLVYGLDEPPAPLIALGALTLACSMCPRELAGHAAWLRTALIVGPLAALLYLASCAIVTPFQASGAAADSTLLELNVRQQGQMALSVFWSLVGVGTLVAGLLRDSHALRIGGLSVLFLAVAKVFIFDLPRSVPSTGSCRSRPMQSRSPRRRRSARDRPQTGRARPRPVGTSTRGATTSATSNAPTSHARATVCRLPFVYGEHGYNRREEFLRRRLRAARRRIPIGSGSWLGSRGHTPELARGLRLLARVGVGRRSLQPLRSDLCADAAVGRADRWRRGRGDRARAGPRRAASLRPLAHRRPVPAPPRRRGQRPRLLGWTHGLVMECVERSVAWHLEDPPAEADDDFAADDRALQWADSAA